MSEVNYKNVYNMIYESSIVYQSEMDLNTDRVSKDSIVLSCVDRHSPKTIVDAGCGQGYYVRKFRDLGINSYGVEVSSACCDTYLYDVPHFNECLNTHFSKNVRVDFLFCSDVLEHLSYEDLDSVLPKMKESSPVALFGIANHSDIINGVELHLIQKNSDWWRSKFLEHYTNVDLLFNSPSNRFFYIECSV